MTDNGGATFGGVSFSSLGLLLTKADIPFLPETRQIEEELPGLDGSVDIATEYGPRPISLEVMLVTEDELDYQLKLQQMAKIFNAKAGVKPLILDRMPGKRWMAKYNGSISTDKIGQLGTFTLPFKAFNPFAESVQDSTGSLEYGQGYLYGMGLRIGDSYSFPLSVFPSTIAVYHAGTEAAYPIIRITGAASNITVTNTTTGESFSLSVTNGVNDVIEINCAPLQQTVRKNGGNASAVFNGKFPRLLEGENSFTITATGSCTVAFLFRHTYLY